MRDEEPAGTLPFTMAWAQEVTRSTLPPSRRLTLLVLATFADRDGGSCYPSHTLLAERTGQGVATVQRALADCEAAGWISRTALGSRGGLAWKRHEYRLQIPEGHITVMAPKEEGCTQGDAGALSPSREGALTVIPEVSKDLSKTLSKEQRRAAKAPALPEWISREAWEGFADMRRRLRKPLTDRAAQLLTAKLGRLRDEGHCPNECLDRSTMNGWQDVYAPKPEVTHHAGQQHRRGGAAGRVAELNQLREAAYARGVTIEGTARRVE